MMPDKKVYAKVTHRFTSNPERVFDAWLDPATIRVWMSAALQTMGLAGNIRTVEVDARTGGKFLFSDQRGDVEARHWGTYLELDRPRRIVFTWIVDQSEESDPSKVTIDFAPDGTTGTLATLTHEMSAAWIEYVSRTEQGWSRMLQAISTLLS